MGRLIAIDKLYMNKIPNSCKECPLTYLDTGDDAYFGANERRCVIDTALLMEHCIVVESEEEL